jgi:hypothetical protein
MATGRPARAVILVRPQRQAWQRAKHPAEAARRSEGHVVSGKINRADTIGFSAASREEKHASRPSRKLAARSGPMQLPPHPPGKRASQYPRPAFLLRACVAGCLRGRSFHASCTCESPPRTPYCYWWSRSLGCSGKQALYIHDPALANSCGAVPK